MDRCVGRLLVSSFALGLALLASPARAEIPFFNASCPGGVDVHADAGGPVYVQGREAVLKRFSDAYVEAKDPQSGLTLSVSRDADGAAQISYTGRDGSNGICQVTATAAASASRPPDQARQRRGIDDRDGDDLPVEVTCESQDQRQHSCDMDTRGAVKVTRQLSRTACVEGQTWGLARHSVWVSGGCRAVFRNTSVRDRVSVAPSASGGLQGAALAACNARKGEQGSLVTQVPVGDDYTEVIADYADGRFMCMVTRDGNVQSVTPLRKR